MKTYVLWIMVLFSNAYAQGEEDASDAQNLIPKVLAPAPVSEAPSELVLNPTDARYIFSAPLDVTQLLENGIRITLPRPTTTRSMSSDLVAALDTPSMPSYTVFAPGVSPLEPYGIPYGLSAYETQKNGYRYLALTETQETATLSMIVLQKELLPVFDQNHFSSETIHSHIPLPLPVPKIEMPPFMNQSLFKQTKMELDTLVFKRKKQKACCAIL